jgi:hypothetical protein
VTESCGLVTAPVTELFYGTDPLVRFVYGTAPPGYAFSTRLAVSDLKLLRKRTRNSSVATAATQPRNN